MTKGSFGDAIFTSWGDVHDFLNIAGISNGDIESRLNSLYNEFIRLQRFEKMARQRKTRGPERRAVNQDVVRTGSMLHLVRTLESVARLESAANGLTEDQKEVLKDAQSKIRADRSANGMRSGFDRRKTF